MIRAAVGISTEPRAARAAIDATRQALERLDGRQADWCVAFTTPDHLEDVPTLVATLASGLGTPYVVGCSASGVLASGREVENGPALGVLAVVSDQIRATPFLFHDAGDHGLTAGVHLGQRLTASRGSDDVLLVWPDPLHVRPDRLLQGLDAVLGGVPVVGGACSARGDGTSTVQFCGGESSSAAVSGIRLGGRFRHAVSVTQGCSPIGEPLRITRAHENLILELDGRPAFEALSEMAPRGLLGDLTQAFDFLFVGLLAAPHEGTPGDYLVRNIITADPDTGVLAISEGVEEGQHLLFVLREGEAARDDLRGVVERISSRSEPVDYRFGLYFNCLARGASLYGAGGVDTALLGRAFPGLPILGLFCNAEIGPVQGKNRLFTYTGVLLLIAE